MCVVIALCPSAFYIYMNVLYTILNNAAFFAFTFRVEKITLNACSSVFLWLLNRKMFRKPNQRHKE